MKENLIHELLQYKAFDEDEAIMVEQVIHYLKTTDHYLGKENLKGHITGSAWIINASGTKALLTHHFKLDRWLQLGGHTELNEDVKVSAYREGLEESGLKSLLLLNEEIFDIDVHWIPERKNEPAHYHYDIRYLFQGDDRLPLNVSHESYDLAWIALDEIESYTQARSVMRMVEKTKQCTPNC